MSKKKLSDVNVILDFKEAVYNLFGKEDTPIFSISNKYLNIFFKEHIIPFVTEGIVKQIETEVSHIVNDYISKLQEKIKKKWDVILLKNSFSKGSWGISSTKESILSDRASTIINKYIKDNLSNIMYVDAKQFREDIKEHVLLDYKESDTAFQKDVEKWIKEEVKAQYDKKLEGKISNFLKENS